MLRRVHVILSNQSSKLAGDVQKSCITLSGSSEDNEMSSQVHTIIFLKSILVIFLVKCSILLTMVSFIL